MTYDERFELRKAAGAVLAAINELNALAEKRADCAKNAIDALVRLLEELK